MSKDVGAGETELVVGMEVVTGEGVDCTAAVVVEPRVVVVDPEGEPELLEGIGLAADELDGTRTTEVADEAREVVEVEVLVDEFVAVVLVIEEAVEMVVGRLVVDDPLSNVVEKPPPIPTPSVKELAGYP